MIDTTFPTLNEIPEIETPPTQDELPYDDGIPMETQRHKLQMDLLVYPLKTWLSQKDAFVCGNMFVYFSPHQVKTHDYRGPDVFVALDVPRGERKSWVVWEEGKGPDVVIELLSSSTAQFDKQEKKNIYQNRLRVPEYFWFDPFNSKDLAGFVLRDGIYEPITSKNQELLVSRQLNLALIRWSGIYQDVEAIWLRWATLEGRLLPTDQEMKEQAQQEAQQAQQEAQQAQQEAQQAQQEAQQAQQEAQQAQQRAKKFAEKLRTLGINPDKI